MKDENKINEALEVCFRTAHLLKEKFPNDIMKITPTTIIAFSKENSRLIRKGRTNMSTCYAYYSNRTPHRIIIKQKALKEREIYSTKLTTHRERKLLHGDFALAELICHELAHHKTSGHARGFKIKYRRLWNYIVNKFISGEFYETKPLYRVYSRV